MIPKDQERQHLQTRRKLLRIQVQGFRAGGRSPNSLLTWVQTIYLLLYLALHHYPQFHYVLRVCSHSTVCCRFILDT